MTTDGTSTSAAKPVGGQTVQGTVSTRRSDIIRVLEPDGTVLDAAKVPVLSDEEWRDVYRSLVRARLLDQALTALRSRGHVDFCGGAAGAEAVAVGSGLALRREDWVFPTQREIGGALQRGMSLQQIADHVYGNVDDVTRGHQLPGHWSMRSAKYASVSAPSSSQMTHAVGFAWAAALKRDPIAVLTYFGDEATDSGSFHDAMNFAGVFKPPVILLCRNASGQPLADKGIAYAVASLRCDGNDLLAVLDTCKCAVARALAGDGATLVEAQLSSEPEHDALTRMRRFVGRQIGWTDADEAKLSSELRGEIDEAMAHAANKAPPPVASIFTDVFAEPTTLLRAQEHELESGPRHVKPTPGRAD